MLCYSEDEESEEDSSADERGAGSDSGLSSSAFRGRNDSRDEIVTDFAGDHGWNERCGANNLPDQNKAGRKTVDELHSHVRHLLKCIKYKYGKDAYDYGLATFGLHQEGVISSPKPQLNRGTPGPVLNRGNAPRDGEHRNGLPKDKEVKVTQSETSGLKRVKAAHLPDEDYARLIGDLLSYERSKEQAGAFSQERSLEMTERIRIALSLRPGARKESPKRFRPVKSIKGPKVRREFDDFLMRAYRVLNAQLEDLNQYRAYAKKNRKERARLISARSAR